MLSLLTIKNIFLIEYVELEFKPGLNTLTGETGVGKSVLLDCLGFVLGWKTSSNLLRDSRNVGEVVAEFSIVSNQDVALILKDCGIEHGGTVLIRRTINEQDGRKRNFINDKVVSLDLIKRISINLIELQDQTGTQILSSEQSHIKFLDKFAGLDHAVNELQMLWKEKQRINKDLEREVSKFNSAELDREYWENSIDEIRQLDIQDGEEEKLDSKRKKIKALERNKEKFEKISKLISESDFESNMSDVISLLDLMRENLGNIVDPAILALDKTLLEFSYAQSEIRELLESQNFNIYDLENIEERLFNLRGLGRKHNVSPNELTALMQRMSDNLISLDSNRNQLSEYRRNLQIAVDAYAEKAKSVSALRIEAAKSLDSAVVKELRFLKMAESIFKTEISPARASPRGEDGVVFKVLTNRGGNFGKLQLISSGGEMSRFLLALRVCLTNQDQGVTMIFDEIDKGIGGATADAVGRRLAKLAKHSQIIVVTHSPQVAAHAAHQWKVEKIPIKDAISVTRIRELNKEDRLTEIARMLAGKEISVEAIAAAKKLLG